MFIDEETETAMKSSGTLGSSKKVGLWRVVVVRNIPYVDARRTGKVRNLNFWQCCFCLYITVWVRDCLVACILHCSINYLYVLCVCSIIFVISFVIVYYINGKDDEHGQNALFLFLFV
jgi:hypothetical protein